jgi:hypothetical protein
MKSTPSWLLGPVVFIGLASGARGDEDFTPLFDGKSLKGWVAPNMTYWSVEDGAITARSTPQNPCTKNQFLVWQGGEVSDFELNLKFRIQGDSSANSGIQIRSVIQADGHAEGYQADITRSPQWTGALYDEHTSRGALARRGERTEIDETGARKTVRFADPDELFRQIRPEDWNEYRITALGPRITLQINGALMSEVVDRQKGHADASGKLALQLHSGPAMTVQFKDIDLKRLPRQ